MATTMGRLAADLNLSRTTVSLILNGRSKQLRISPKTKSRVLKRANELGYRRNALAASLKKGRSGNIGVVLTNIKGVQHHRALAGIQRGLGGQVVAMVGVTEYDPLIEARLITSFLERRVDGLIIVYSGHQDNDHLLQEIRDQKMPLVLLDRHCATVETNNVASDNHRAGELAGSELLEHVGAEGHYAFVSASHMVTSTCDRIAGFRASLSASGITPTVYEASDLDAPDPRACGQVGLQQLSKLGKGRLALFANDAVVATGIILEARRLRLRMPEDLVLCHMDELETGGFTTLPTISLVQDVERMGEMAARIVLDEITRKKPSQACRHVLLDVKLTSNLACDPNTST